MLEHPEGFTCHVFFSAESSYIARKRSRDIAWKPITRKIGPLQPRNDHRKARTQRELTATAWEHHIVNGPCVCVCVCMC